MCRNIACKRPITPLDEELMSMAWLISKIFSWHDCTLIDGISPIIIVGHGVILFTQKDATMTSLFAKLGYNITSIYHYL